MSKTSGRLEVPEWATAGLAEATRLSDEILRRGPYNHQIDYEVANCHWRVEALVEEEVFNWAKETIPGPIFVEAWVDRGYDEWEFVREGLTSRWWVKLVSWSGNPPLQVPPAPGVVEGEGMRR